MEEIINILEVRFNVMNVSVSHLYGYDNANYLVESGDEKYVFKQYVDVPGLFEVLSAENRILNLLGKEMPGKFQVPVAGVDGEYIYLQDIKGAKSIFRLIHYIEGDLMADVEHTPEMYWLFGEMLAKMDLVLLPVRDIRIEARRYEKASFTLMQTTGM